MPIDYMKMVIEQQAVFANLFSRMDKDKDLLIQKEYTLFDRNDREAPDVENLTLNDAAVFVNHVEAVLGRANMTIEVTGEKLKDEVTSLYESFFRDWSAAADEELNSRDIPSFSMWNIQQVCARGRIASRVMLRQNGETFSSGLLPLDARRVVYEVGTHGLKWVAPNFYRTKQQIIDEYGEEIGNRVRGSHATVTTLYIDELELVFIEKEQVREQKHGYSELPFIIQVCPSGLMMQDDDQIERSGESLLGLGRNLFESKNKIASLLDTLNMGAVFGGLQMEVESVSGAKRPDKPPYGKRFVVPVQKGTRGFFPMPIADIRNATTLLYNILNTAIENATLPRVSYGTVNTPISGVGIAQLKEAEYPVYRPRINALQLYYERLYRMVLNQFVQMGMKVNLGTPGFLKEYSYEELKEPVAIKCKIETISPMENMANISIAAAVGNLVSRDTKQRKYLQLENPDEENDRILSELGSQVSPALAKYEIARALADRGEEIKARLIAEEIGLSLDQLMSGKLEQQPVPLGKEPTQLVPMFGRGQGIETATTEIAQ